MFKSRTYRSVVEMARATGGDPAFVEDLEKHLAERRLVRHLFALRCARGLSQKAVAEKMGCTQGKVSKLEASRDEDLSLGDIRGYAKALGLTTILGLEGGPSAVARIKFHHACVTKQVNSLAKLAAKDDMIAKGVSRFFSETALNFLDILDQATKKLPPEVQLLGVAIEIVGPDDEGCQGGAENGGSPEAAIPKVRRKRKPAPAN
jgi:transcriptional regulator with XRE-family HTH domain